MSSANFGALVLTIPVVGGTGISDERPGYVNVRDLGDGNQDRSHRAAGR